MKVKQRFLLLFLALLFFIPDQSAFAASTPVYSGSFGKVPNGSITFGPYIGTQNENFALGGRMTKVRFYKQGDSSTYKVVFNFGKAVKLYRDAGGTLLGTYTTYTVTGINGNANTATLFAATNVPSGSLTSVLDGTTFEVFKVTPAQIKSFALADVAADGVTVSYDTVGADKVVLYRNGNPYVTLSSETGTYKDTIVTPGNSYDYKLYVENELGSSSSGVLTATIPLPPVAPPVLSAGLVEDSHIRLEWTGEGNSYDVYQGTTKLTTTIYKFFDVTKLDPDTSYSFKVVQTDRYHRESTSNVLTVKTKPPMLGTPKFSITDVTHKDFLVKWQPVNYATSYTLLLDGHELFTTESATTYTVTGLSPSTVYRVTLRVSNEIDSKETTLSTTTLKQPVPEITSAYVSPVAGDMGKRMLNYTANDQVTAVRVYLEGKLLGEYPVSQGAIELDVNELTGLLGNLKIEPVDPDGVPYEFTFPTKSTGNEDVDNLLLDWLKAFGFSKSAFVYLALASIPVLLAVALFFWLRFKFQGMYGKTANQKGEMKDSKGAAIRQSNKDKFDPEPPKTGKFRGKRKQFKPWDQMTEKEQSDWKAQKQAKDSPQRFSTSSSGGAVVNQLMSAMTKIGKEDYQKRFTRGRGSSKKKSSVSFKPRGNVGARASPKSQTQSYKGKTYELGKRGDYKPFGNQGRKFK